MDFTCTVEGKRQLILNPTTAAGNPAPLDGPPVVTILEGPGTVEPDIAGGLPFFVSSGQLGAVTIFEVGGDPDLAEGQQVLITEEMVMTEVAAQAITLGIGVSGEVPK